MSGEGLFRLPEEGDLGEVSAEEYRAAQEAVTGAAHDELHLDSLLATDPRVAAVVERWAAAEAAHDGVMRNLPGTLPDATTGDVTLN